MPTYEYACENCDNNFEVVQSIHDNPLLKCDKCKKKKLYRVIGLPYIMNHTEPKTLAQLAERNEKHRFGKYELEEKRRTAKTQTKDVLSQNLPKGAGPPIKREAFTPWWRPGTDKPVDLKKIKNVKKYVETGEK